MVQFQENKEQRVHQESVIVILIKLDNLFDGQYINNLHYFIIYLSEALTGVTQ